MTAHSIFCSEALTRGHPDKLCDQISDAIVDACLTADPAADVLAECAVTKGILFIAAQLTTEEHVDLPSVARDVIRGTGYPASEFDAESCAIMTTLTPAPERGLAAADPARFAAQQFATLFGYACRQSPALMPLPIWLARRLARAMDDARESGTLPFLSPDGQCQVAVEYAADGTPARIHGITLLCGLIPEKEAVEPGLTEMLRKHVLDAAFDGEAIRPDHGTALFVNPQTLVRSGGPARHPGLTGRKMGADTYGEYARQSSAALSGKGPARIDRIGVYAARHGARNIVAAGLADTCEVQLSYVIGQPQPVSVQVRTDGTGALSDEELALRLSRAVDLRPAAIAERFGLRQLPVRGGGHFYRHLAAYGQVGRDDVFCPWELDDLVGDFSA